MSKDTPKDPKKSPESNGATKPTAHAEEKTDAPEAKIIELDEVQRETDRHCVDGLIGVTFADELAEAKKTSKNIIGAKAESRVANIEATIKCLRRAELALDKARAAAARLDSFADKDAPGQTKADLDAAKANRPADPPKVTHATEFVAHCNKVREAATKVAKASPLDHDALNPSDMPEALTDFPVDVPKDEVERWDEGIDFAWDTAIAEAQFELAEKARANAPGHGIESLSRIKAEAANLKRTQPKDWPAVRALWPDLSLYFRCEILSDLGVTAKGDIVQTKSEASA